MTFFLQLSVVLSILIHLCSAQYQGLGSEGQCYTKLNQNGIPMCDAIWKDCGSTLTIQNVTVSTFRRRNAKKVALFKGTESTFCIEGIADNIEEPIVAIQASVHGKVFGVKQPFCGVDFNGCNGLEGGCPINTGDTFKFCLSIAIPDVAPAIPLKIFWRLLRASNTPTQCQKEYDTDSETLICLKIPAQLRNNSELKKLLEAQIAKNEKQSDE